VRVCEGRDGYEECDPLATGKLLNAFDRVAPIAQLFEHRGSCCKQKPKPPRRMQQIVHGRLTYPAMQRGEHNRNSDDGTNYQDDGDRNAEIKAPSTSAAVVL